MKTGLLLPLLILLVTQARTQSADACDCYDRLCNLALYYEAQQDYEKASLLWLKGLGYKEKERWTAYEYYKLGLLQAKSENYQEAADHVVRALSMGFDADYLDDESFDGLKASPYWAVAFSQLDALRKAFQQDIQLDYLLAVTDIRGSDQTIRRLIEVPDSTFAHLDSLNFGRIKKLIQTHGYPNFQDHGFGGNKGVYLVLLHAAMYSESTYREAVAILENAVEQFAYRKSKLAQFIDRREVWYHKRLQIYGTWNAYRAKEFKPIRNIAQIDEHRWAYNLLRLKEQSVMEQRNLPAGYQPQDYPEDYFCGHPAPQ